jgi:methyl-accepting chemotaxis protein
MDDKLTIFIAVTAAAVVLQMLILAGMYFAIRKLAGQVTTVTEEVKSQALPLLQEGKQLQSQVKRIIDTSSPKLELVLDNAAAITTTAHAGLGRVDNAVNDILDRARLQVIRADEMVTRALDQVEDTTSKVAHTVTSPVKHATGIMQGIGTGLGAYFGSKRVRERVPADEMFI